MVAKNFIHPLDKDFTGKIFQIESFKKFMDEMHEDELDEVCDYFYSASLPEIRDSSLRNIAEQACDKFSIPPIKLYLKRSYEFDVECAGYNNPIIILPAVLLEKDDYEIIQGRIFAAAGAIAANHHRLAFIIWAIENLSGFANIPVFGDGVKFFFYEWSRARVFTQDRAFLMATENFSLTLKNILYGAIPFDVLEKFNFATKDDTFSEQVQRYLNNDNPAQMIGKAFSFFSDYAWLPRRYEEIQNFYTQRGVINENSI